MGSFERFEVVSPSYVPVHFLNVMIVTMRLLGARLLLLRTMQNLALVLACERSILLRLSRLRERRRTNFRLRRRQYVRNVRWLMMIGRLMVGIIVVKVGAVAEARSVRCAIGGEVRILFLAAVCKMSSQVA